MPYAEASLPVTHIQAGLPDDPPTFQHAEFVGSVDNIRRLRNGAALLSVVVEPDWVEQILPLWHANTIVSFNVAPWEPDWADDDYE